MRSLLLALTGFAFLSVLAAPLSAQPTADTFRAVAHVAQDQVASVEVLVGTYATADAALRITRSGDALVLTPTGQPALDIFIDGTADARLNTRAEGLLRDAFSGNLERLRSALPAHRRETGTEDFARLLTTLTDRHGAVASVVAFGTTAETEDRSATLVRVAFAEGDELLKLVWRGGDLALITRGTLPTFAAQPVPGEPSYAVLNTDDTVRAVATFDGERVTVQSAAGTFTASRIR